MSVQIYVPRETFLIKESKELDCEVLLLLHMTLTNNKKLNNKVIGAKGELIVANYYKNKGFEVLDMNYLKKWGEIDVIVQKENKVHFIEVKTVSYETKKDLEKAVTYGTWRPEENVHAHKLQKIGRTIETWLQEHNWVGEWQFDVAAVRVVTRETFATVKILDNIII